MQLNKKIFCIIFEGLLSFSEKKWTLLISMTRQTADRQKVTVTLQMGQMGNFDQTSPNLCNFLSHDPIY